MIKGPSISTSYLGFRNRNLRVWSCSYVVTVMTLKLLRVGELCALVPLLSSLDVKELPGLGILGARRLPVAAGKAGFAAALHGLSSAVG